MPVLDGQLIKKMDRIVENTSIGVVLGEEKGSFYFDGQGGVRLHCIERGDGPAMVLLHGFPQFWWSWRHQIAHFESRYRVFAPDLRGYNLSDHPKGWEYYEAGRLVLDVVALIRRIQRGPKSRKEDSSVLLIGQDWGGAIAWLTAMYFPELVRKLVVLSFPHPLVAQKHWQNPLQRIRSAPLFFFQIPAIPEFALNVAPHLFYSHLFRGDTGNGEAFLEDVIQAYVDAQKRAGSLTGPLHYFRNFVSRGWVGFDHPPQDPLHIPTLLIWGDKDRYFHSETMQEHGLSEHISANFRVETIAAGSHWLPEQFPDRVNQLIGDFLD